MTPSPPSSVRVGVRLTFPEGLVREPIVARLVREFDVLANLLGVRVEEHVGWILCELVGEDAEVERAIAWLTEIGVRVDRQGDLLES